MNNVEILAPAGDEQTAYVALKSGADAIYLGLSRYSARAGAENLDLAALARVTRYAHLLGAKVYVTFNTLVKDSETEDFFRSVRLAWEAGADAILLQDIFLGRELKKAYPEMVLHLSTQAGCCNVYGARLAKEYGFSRAVLARETPFEEIALIAREIETEVFVQGALCTCFSGQCYLSSFAGNNSGNRGRCKQPCRKQYAIDRKGYETCSYALSTSDLSLGMRLDELIKAGVYSFKIEGRLRRPEYVEAAVRYYREVLSGGNTSAAFSRLARAYNRGDFTEGLGFGQKGDFLTRNVQGHIGEKVGVISLVNGKYYCKSSYRAARGDGFKILRGGKEVGGAVFQSADENGFTLSSRARLERGDEVRLTTSHESVQGEASLHRVRVQLRFVAGEPMEARCGTVALVGAPLEKAERIPLTEEDLKANFMRVDGLPFAPEIEVETENAFLPKAALNAFRRSFYERLAESLAPAGEPLAEHEFSCEITPAQGAVAAVIASDDFEDSALDDGRLLKGEGQARLPKGQPLLTDGGHGEKALLSDGGRGEQMLLSDGGEQYLTEHPNAGELVGSPYTNEEATGFKLVGDTYSNDNRAALEIRGESALVAQTGLMKSSVALEKERRVILIEKPRSYSHLSPRADVWLYLPPFLTTAETDDILSRAKGYAGVYAEGYFALAAARKYGLKLFAGTGFNLTNRFSVTAVKEEGAAFVTLSKELSSAEQRALAIEGAFALSLGDIKVMDILYCPFSKTCATCDRRNLYTLTDEDGRKFPLRRYAVNGQCRFEMYNCAPLAAYNGATNALADCSTGKKGLASYALAPERAALKGATKGHANRSMR